MDTITLYIVIAKVKIKIIFKYEKYKYEKYEFFIKAIQLRYKNFITSRKNNIDYTIEVIVNDITPKVYYDNSSNVYYIQYFQESAETKITTYYDISVSQFSQIILKILDRILSKSNGFILHASCLHYKDKAYIFLAPSGGGKSTLSTFSKNKIKILADDHIAIRKINNTYRVFILPDVHTIALIKRYRRLNQIDFPIGAIFLIHKSDKWSLSEESANIQDKLMAQLLTQKNSYKNVMCNGISFFKSQEKKIYNLFFPKKSKEYQLVEILDRLPKV